MIDEGCPLAIIVFAKLHEQDEIHHSVLALQGNRYRLADPNRVQGDSLDLSNLDTVTVPFQLPVPAATQGKIALLINDAIVTRAIKSFILSRAKKGILRMSLRQISIRHLWSTKFDFSTFASCHFLAIFADYSNLIRRDGAS
jgi:hypothetical protein